MLALNAEIAARASAAGIVVTRVAGDGADHPEFHADYGAFLAPHYDANIYGDPRQGGSFWDRGEESLTAAEDDRYGNLFWAKWLALPGAPTAHFERRNANTKRYYGFNLTSAKTPGIIVEHGVGAPGAPDYDWLRANLGLVAQTHVDTLLAYFGIQTQDPRFAMRGASGAITAPTAYGAEAVAAYRVLAPAAGFRLAMVVAQAYKETGYFRFGGRAQEDWHNPCGLGVGALPLVRNGVQVPNSADCRFPTWEAGVRAHLGHLLMYYTTSWSAHVPGFCDADPRHGAHLGLPNDARAMNGKWAVPGPTYGQDIAALAATLTAAPPDFWAHADDEPFTWGDAKAYATRLGAQLEAEFQRKGGSS